jgi:hypothetical protein
MGSGDGRKWTYKYFSVSLFRKAMSFSTTSSAKKEAVKPPHRKGTTNALDRCGGLGSSASLVEGFDERLSDHRWMTLQARRSTSNGFCHLLRDRSTAMTA